MIPEFQACSTCKLEKPSNAFYPNRDPITMDGHPLGYTCKQCLSLYQKKRRLLKKPAMPWFDFCD